MTLMMFLLVAIAIDAWIFWRVAVWDRNHR